MSKYDNKYKYDHSKEYHKEALLHAIGQLEEIHQRPVKISDIMQFMNMSKPTVIKYLKRLKINGRLIMSKEKYRKNAKQWKVILTWYIRLNYLRGAYKDSYYEYIANRYGVQLS